MESARKGRTRREKKIRESRQKQKWKRSNNNTKKKVSYKRMNCEPYTHTNVYFEQQQQNRKQWSNMKHYRHETDKKKVNTSVTNACNLHLCVFVCLIFALFAHHLCQMSTDQYHTNIYISKYIIWNKNVVAYFTWKMIKSIKENLDKLHFVSLINVYKFVEQMSVSYDKWFIHLRKEWCAEPFAHHKVFIQRHCCHSAIRHKNMALPPRP